MLIYAKKSPNGQSGGSSEADTGSALQAVPKPPSRPLDIVESLNLAHAEECVNYEAR